MAPRSVRFGVRLEVKQRWLVIRWGTKNLLSRASQFFGTLSRWDQRRIWCKPLVPAAFAVVSTLQTALDPCGGL
jgi:hypothetical protein